MKIRSGFVSNSSSSSFLICFKKPTTAKNKEEFSKFLGIKPGSVGAAIFGPLAEVIWNAKPQPLEYHMKNYGYEDIEEWKRDSGPSMRRLIEALEKGWEVREVSGSSEDYGPATYFYYVHPDADESEFQLIPLD